MKIRVLSANWENEFKVHRFPITVGREGNDLNLADAHLSRKHALIYRDNQGDIRICDRDTTNGTWVNDERVDDAPFRPGDVITVGNTTIEIVAEDDRKKLDSSLTGWPEFEVMRNEDYIVK